MVDRHALSDAQVIRDIRDQLVSKNCLLRSVKSQVDNPDRVTQRILKKQEQIDLLTIQIHDMKHMLFGGMDVVDQLITDIESLEDKLNLLANKSAIAHMKRLVAKIEASGMTIDELRSENLRSEE